MDYLLCRLFESAFMRYYKYIPIANLGENTRGVDLVYAGNGEKALGAGDASRMRVMALSKFIS
jgi:hypothetical protein